MNSYATLARFEDNDQAVLELSAGVTLNVPRSWLPPKAREGDVLRLKVREGVTGTSSFVSFSIDAVKTAERREEATELRASLPKAPDGDIKL